LAVIGRGGAGVLDGDGDHKDRHDPASGSPGDGTKPSGQEVGPPPERVDDETSKDDAKVTRRQD
jgi:hypothetical protein